jgi:segregation and condensation protein A
MSFNVSTAVFEGPLDLLLQLITKHQVDIAEVSLAGLVAEYLRCVDEMLDLDLEVTSEFVLIAATLIELKARHLLPSPDDFDLDEELALREERDRLLSRLLLCVTFKDVAAVFQRRLAESERFVFRTCGIDQPISSLPQEVVFPVDLLGFAQTAGRLFQRRVAQPDVDHLDLDLPSVEDAIVDIQQRMHKLVTATFDDLVDEQTGRSQIAAYFLALLELARWGLLAVSQEDSSSPIKIEERQVLDLRNA